MTEFIFWIILDNLSIQDRFPDFIRLNISFNDSFKCMQRKSMLIFFNYTFY